MANITISPQKTYINITLSKGKHKLSCKQSNVADETFSIEDLPYGIINPTKSKYIRYYFVYARNLDKNRFVPYKIEDMEVYAIHEPEILTDLFIEDRTNGNDGNIDKDIPDFKELNNFNPDSLFRQYNIYQILRCKAGKQNA